MLSRFETIEVGNIDHGNGMVGGQGTWSFVHNPGPQPLLIATPCSLHKDTVSSHLILSKGSAPLSEIMLAKFSCAAANCYKQS